MKEEIERIRRCGYAEDNEEAVSGICYVAAPIRADRVGVIAAMSASGTPAQIPDELTRRHARLVQEAALRVSIQLGYRPPTSDLNSLLGPVELACTF